MHFTETPADKLLNRYGIALAMVSITFALQIIVSTSNPKLIPLTLFMAPIVASAWIGGVGPGLLAVFLGTFVEMYFFIEPRGELRVTMKDDVTRLIIFCVQAFSIVLIVTGYRNSGRGKLHASRAQLRVALDAATRSEALAASQKERLRIAMDATQLGVWEQEFTTGKISWSQRASEILGITYAELDNSEELCKCVHPDDRAAVMEGLSEAKRPNGLLGPYKSVFRIDCGHGYRHVRVFGEVRFGEDKVGNRQAVSVVGTIQDCTEEIILQNELKAAKLAAESASAAKSAFLANMSHEIRTPLGAVLGFSDLLVGLGQANAEAAEYAAAIRRNGNLLSTIISDILDLSKVEANCIEVERCEVPLHAIVNDLNALLHLQASEKGLSLTTVTSSNLPATILTDRLRLRQILVNIIGNAIKFTEKGGVKVTFAVTEAERPMITIDVADTGRGMSSVHVEKLFQPFSQGDISTTRMHGGTGLGLILAKKLAQVLGGDVTLLATVPDKGSTFRILIDPGPIISDLAANAAILSGMQADSRSEAKDLTSEPFNGIRILVAEDSLDNQMLMERVLTRAGAKVTLASNGREAHEIASHQKFDVILMDLQMPEMDGYEAVKILRQQGFQSPIVALTAHALKEDRDRCIEAGFSDHITKPISHPKLIDDVRRLIATCR